MKKWLFIYLAVLVLLSTSNVEAVEPCRPTSYPSLLRCMLSESTEFKIAKKQLEAAGHLEGIAGQWLNPELGAESVQERADKSETSAALLFDIRLGGKRGAIMEVARGEAEKAKAGYDLNSSQVKLDLILKIYRLSHLKNEIGIETESVETFNKIIKQYQRKAAHSPEQEVSLSVFRMAATDHQLSLVKLKSEQEKVLQDLVTSTSLSKETILKNLPARIVSWPTVPSPSEISSSPHSRFAKGELMASKGAFEKAKADSWPDLKIGPSIKLVKVGLVKENYYGLSLAMPLPIFSLNGSGRSYGESKLSEVELNFELSNRRISSMRAQLSKKYQAMVEVLKGALSEKAIEEKHERTEQHFFKGLVSSSLVIEAHRQLIELEEKRNESEREAIEAISSIYIIDNTFSEVIL